MQNLTQKDLEQKYLQIPGEIKQTRRWICYNEDKIPMNPLNGRCASTVDPLTWSTFNVAVMGCVKYGFCGIGFVLGEDKVTGTNYFGIDLDNHPDKVTGLKAMNDDEFYDFSTEFVNALNSYTEYSHSGEGVHIICKGTLPAGARRRAGVPIEMYDNKRYFTMTGNIINNAPISDRTEEVKPLWEKYLNVPEQTVQREVGIIVHDDDSVTFGGADRLERTSVEFARASLSDSELIEKIRTSQNGPDFLALYNGDMSRQNNDHSAADLAFCKLLAFWTGNNKDQMDRIFRTSALMRDKWDKKRGDDTYGSLTLDKAISNQYEFYVPAKEKIELSVSKPLKVDVKVEQQAIEQINEEQLVFDEKGDPIITLKQIFKTYPLTDTGNAERFYDYFGKTFRFNTDGKFFMYWDGKTWKKDDKNYVRKFANRIIDVLKGEIKNTQNEIDAELKKGEGVTAAVKELQGILKGQQENLKRVANKAGKDAMISELQSLHELPVKNSEFDTQEFLLNTDSGVVDLKTGNVLPFDKKLMLSKNTNCKVSYETPKNFLKFAHDIFKRDSEEETQEIIDTWQMALGDSLTGRTNKEYLYVLYGNGSNGKSTAVRTVGDVMGDYTSPVNSGLLIQSPNASTQSTEFSMSALVGARFVPTSETAADKKLDEVTIKQMTSGERMNAQFKFGNPFSFMPTFSIWMSTNNLPIIRATDFGTWRRIFFFPFLNTFKGENKDVEMPKKLRKEAPQILGWMIQGAVKLFGKYNGNLPRPRCLEVALSEYKSSMDVVAVYLRSRCSDFSGYETSATALYQDYKDWAKANTEWLMSETRFKTELGKRGYKVKKDVNDGEKYIGLKLNSDKKGFNFSGMED